MSNLNYRSKFLVLNKYNAPLLSVCWCTNNYNDVIIENIFYKSKNISSLNLNFNAPQLRLSYKHN